ncbi:SRPBCC family protein [Metallosphaera tengchongensis]|uniref:SRPBCC family protein n=1 Tax=Metallosphaera tengchongensis TaxID=1532350 RepID=A0A6N0NVF7_9CREN|nr:SRPBCC family protein [Metallosphaera tengchongensis]QKQ99120.1 SRPBCC family protein [Metallosphaera tengchongensis]
MIEFLVVRSFKPLRRETVWEVIREVNSMPQYWKGIRELNVRQVSDRTYEGAVRFAFPSSSDVRIDLGEFSLTMNFLKGILKGMNRIEVSSTEVTSHWKVEMPLYMKPFEKRNEEHFRSGTEHALDRILEEAKRRSQG